MVGVANAVSRISVLQRRIDESADDAPTVGPGRNAVNLSNKYLI